MFSSNPWGAYITILAPLLAGYYLFVGLRFYARDLKARMSQKGNPTASQRDLSQQDFDTPDPPAGTLMPDPSPTIQTPVVQTNQPVKDDDAEQLAHWQNEELFDQVEQLAAHLKGAIEEAYEKDYSTQDLVLLLQMTLKEYSALVGTSFQTAINNLIETECAKYGPIHLREEDLATVWKQVP